MVSKEQARHYNRHRNAAPSYSVGDVVLLSSDGIHWPAFSESPPAAIPNYFGPFAVLAVDNEKENVTLQLPQSFKQTRIHPVFHVSKLKPFHNRVDVFPNFSDSFDRPDSVSVNSDGDSLFAIDKILNKRVRHGHSEYLVHFKGYPDSHAQWEPLTPSNRSSWESDWPLLLKYDSSIGPFQPVVVSKPRRSTRLTSSRSVHFPV